MHGGTNQSGHRTLHRIDSPEKLERQQEGKDNEREPETSPPPPPSSLICKAVPMVIHTTDVVLGDTRAPPPPPPPPSVQSTTPKEIVHATDVTLTLSSDIQDKGFLRVITKVKVCEYAYSMNACD